VDEFQDWFGMNHRSFKKLTCTTTLAEVFETNCSAVIDEVQAKSESIIITKRGKPVVKLVPVSSDRDDFFNFMRGKGKIIGDVVNPVLAAEE
jgi:prevent-host-death family protein